MINAPKLDTLPNELLCYILSFLSLNELVPLRSCNKQLNAISRTPYLLDQISLKALRQLINAVKLKHPDYTSNEIQEYLNLVWGNSFFESYKLTWKEYMRELGALLKHPSISDEVKKTIQARLNMAEQESVLSMWEMNKLIVKINSALCKKLGKHISFSDHNSDEYDFSGIGITRILVEHMHRQYDTPAAISSLNLKNNHIKYLPDTLADLTELWNLNLDNNEVQQLSIELKEFDKLKYIHIHDNDLASLSASNMSCIKQLYSSSRIDSIMRSQKHHKRRAWQALNLATNHIIMPLILLREFTAAHFSPNEEENTADIRFPPIVSEPIGLILTLLVLYGMFAFILKAIAQISEDNHNFSYIPLREKLINHCSLKTPAYISKKSEDSNAYLTGRQSSQAWTPYLNSFLKPDAYSRAYYAGLDDARNQLPSRLEGARPFKSYGKRLLGL